MNSADFKQQHVRPKLRNRPTAAAAARPAAKQDDDVDRLLEHTRQRIQSQLEISSRHNGVISASRQVSERVAPTAVITSEAEANTIRPPNEKSTLEPKSILKIPKYSSSKEKISANKPMDMSKTPAESPDETEKPRAAVVKDMVVERREPIPRQGPFKAETFSVEGHIPKENSKDPLVFSSISELMTHAGTLPRQEDSSTPRVVEADLSFACMTAEEYDETVMCAESMDINHQDGDAAGDLEGSIENAFIGNEDMFPDDTDEYRSDCENDSLFGGSSVASEGDDVPPPEPRAFMKLWEAITDWTTPETVYLLKQWREQVSDGSNESNSVQQVDKSDVGSSRRRGLKAMLMMYLPSTLDNLGLREEDKRRIELRLDNFLRTLSFSKPMVKFNTKLWKAMTCVLVDMVLLDRSSSEQMCILLPAAVQEVGLVPDEYKYLTRSAVTNLG